MLSSPDNVGEGIIFSLFRSFVRSDVRFDHFDKTDSEYSLASSDDLIRLWRSKVNQVHLPVQYATEIKLK